MLMSEAAVGQLGLMVSIDQKAFVPVTLSVS